MEKITIQEPRNIESPSREKDEMALEVASLHQVSDGYHTIQELYDHRIRLFIALCKSHNCLVDSRKDFAIEHGNLNNHTSDEMSWRSKKHSDGKDSYEGLFIMGINKEKGQQISYHIPLSYWDETDFAETLNCAPKWDGHNSADVLERLKIL